MISPSDVESALALAFALMFYFVAVRGTIALIVSYGRVKTEKHLSWRKVSGTSTLTPVEFVQRIQNICLIKKWLLVEITEQSATIRTYPNFWSYGMYFYIEFDQDAQNVINVFYRDSIRNIFEYQPPARNILNLLYKA